MQCPFLVLNLPVINTKICLNNLPFSNPLLLLLNRKKTSTVQSLRHNVQPTLNVLERRDGGERIIIEALLNFSV